MINIKNIICHLATYLSSSSFIIVTISMLNISFVNGVSLSATNNSPFEVPKLLPSQMNVGGVGLLHMPTARASYEGEFNFSAFVNNEYNFFTLTLQPLSWLEATVRYALVNDLLYSADASFSGKTKYTDKSIDVKIRLLQESTYAPELAIGLRDFAGTGLFSGEFVAATKRYVNNNLGIFDFTLGLGFGYLGTRGNIKNVICVASDSFCSRPTDFAGKGGMFDYDRWFKGSSSVFGGIEYQTLHAPLRFKLEYDGNDYSQDFPAKVTNMCSHTPFNFGVLYRISNFADLHLSYERGDTLGFGMSLFTNFNNLKSSWVDDQAPDINLATSSAPVNWEQVSNDLQTIAGYENAKIYLNDDTLAVVGKQVKYRDRSFAGERASAILTNAATDHVTTFLLAEQNSSLTGYHQKISREKYVQYANVEYIDPQFTDTIIGSSSNYLISEHSDKHLVYDNYKRFDYGVAPHIVQSFGSAESFYLFSAGIIANANYWLTDHLELSGALYWDLYNNYDKFTYIRPNDGTDLPRARTMFRAYATEHSLAVNSLQLTWLHEYSSNITQQFYAGYLESMFAGVGTEILYRRQNSNWAIGADVNLVSQRNPRTYFGIFKDSQQNIAKFGHPFKVVDKAFTGVVSSYYFPQWEFLSDLMIRVDVGQFLVGDVGSQINIAKHFDSGIIVGAYASFSNLSSEEFGEGSFTKGFYLSIPFDVITVKPSNNRASINWQPLTRDGGQKLQLQNQLIEVTDSKYPWYQKPNTANKNAYN